MPAAQVFMTIAEGDPVNGLDPDGSVTIFVHGTWSNALVHLHLILFKL